jgi:hypothetical protein
MANRDEFSKRTKHFLALRASNRCSFTGCPQVTVGPGADSPFAITNIGEAAHICAASPGGKRYVETMTAAERSDIANGIWLCANHARLIDRDDSQYTVEALSKMKQLHEQACAASVRNASAQAGVNDLIAIGPEVIVLGELRDISASEWSLHVEAFVTGEIKTLIDFVDRFGKLESQDRYILVNALGDGRLLSAAPAFAKSSPTFVIRCPIDPGFARIRAQDLGGQMATHPETNDLYLRNGNIARVSGLDSLPQHLRQSLSLRRGESPFHPLFGTRIEEYFMAFRDTPWLEKLIKLEIIRMAAIPYHDQTSDRYYTPLRCVDRVREIVVVSSKIVNKRLPIRIDLDVHGVGRWQSEVSILAGE